MSDREFTPFDVDTIADAVRQPSLDNLRSAARIRRRRRSRLAVLTALVALAGMAAVPLAARSGGTDWADQDHPPGRSDRGIEFYLTGPDSGVGVETVDFGCTLRFTHTDDGGRTWTDWDLARYRSTTCRVTTSGNKEADMDFSVLGQRSYLVRDGDRFRLSTDFGRTWGDADEAIVAVPAFPTQARPVFCQQDCRALRQPVAVDPSTGKVYRLTGEQPSSYPRSIYPSPDGAIWVTYSPGDTDRRAVVARTADGGATWTTWRSAENTDVIAVVGVSGREAYMVIEPVPPAGAGDPSGLSRLLQTRDGGKTWSDIATDLYNSVASRWFTIGSDGSLLVVKSGLSSPSLTSEVQVSRDAGRHFATARRYSRFEGAVGVAPGYAWLYGRDDMSAIGPDHVQLTGDGSSWTRFALPD